MRRLSRRGGVKRISALIYNESRTVLKAILENIITLETLLRSLNMLGEKLLLRFMLSVYSLNRKGRISMTLEKRRLYS